MLFPVLIIQILHLFTTIRSFFTLMNKDQSTKPLVFYHKMNQKIFLLKLIPGIDGKVLDALFPSYDGLIIESFGVGGLPHYENDDFMDAISPLD